MLLTASSGRQVEVDGAFAVPGEGNYIWDPVAGNRLLTQEEVDAADVVAVDSINAALIRRNAWLVSQGLPANAFLVEIGMVLPPINAQGLGFYNFGDGIAAYVPIGDARFIPQPQHSDGGFFQQTLSPYGIAESMREVHGGASVILAPFAVLGGVAAAGAVAGGGEAVAGGSVFVGDIPIAGEAGTSIYSTTAAPVFTGADAALGNVVAGEGASESSVLGTLGNAAINKAASTGVSLLVSKLAQSFRSAVAPKPSTATGAGVPVTRSPAASSGDGWLGTAALVGVVLLLVGSN